MGDFKGFVKGSFKGSIRVQGLGFTVGFRGLGEFPKMGDPNIVP